MTVPVSETPAPSHSFSGKIFTVLLLLGVAYAAWLAVWRVPMFSFFVYDDTYIGLRYIANFLHTGHFQWNIGETVEGYTDPLRLFLIAIPGAFGMDLLEATHLVNLLSYGGFVLLLYFALRQCLGNVVALMPAALAAACPPLIAWIWGGLDPPLTVFLLGCAQGVMLAAFLDPAARNEKSALLSAVFFSLALLVRLDNALFVIPAAVAWLAFCKLKSLRPFLVFCGVIAGVVIAQEIIRLAVYGDFLPNTFYNKVMGTPAATFATGFQYVMDALTEPPYYYAGGIFALVQLYILHPKRRGFVLYAAAGMALNALYVASVGGDFMPGRRFMLCWLPLCLLAIGLLLEKPDPNLRSAQVLRAMGLVISLALLKSCFVLAPDLHEIDGTAVAGQVVGEYIEAHWPKGSVVGVNAAGIVPYLNPDKNFVDMLGLNDRTIAKRAMPDYGLAWQKKPGHGKGDGAYVLKRAPDFIVLSSAAGDNGANSVPVFAGDVELKNSAEFKRCYRHEVKELPWPKRVLDQGVIKEPNFNFAYYRRVCPRP